MLTQNDLDQFTGSEQFFRHPLMPKVVYTEGVQHLAEHGGAYWLVDKIATLQLEPKVRAEEFQVWKLTVNGDNTAKLACEDGDHNQVYSEDIDYTDFPLPQAELWFTNNTILLPSEY